MSRSPARWGTRDSVQGLDFEPGGKGQRSGWGVHGPAAPGACAPTGPRRLSRCRGGSCESAALSGLHWPPTDESGAGTFCSPGRQTLAVCSPVSLTACSVIRSARPSQGGTDVGQPSLQTETRISKGCVSGERRGARRKGAKMRTLCTLCRTRNGLFPAICWSGNREAPRAGRTGCGGEACGLCVPAGGRRW